nr:tetratricopeptide repeat protein [Catenulispora acidiphila]
MISALAGVGKTALAIHSAHRLAGRFPDGCLFLDLRGFTPGHAPLSSFEALGALLALLDVPVATIHSTEPARSAQFQAETAGARLLLVLDNAADAHQVRLLLPSAPGCRVLVTSRNRLVALDEAVHLDLRPLAEVDAAALFRMVSAGGRVSQSTVDGIVARCAGVPLALRIAAARCAPGGAFDPELLAAELSRAEDFIGQLDDGERSVRAVFDASFSLLPRELRQVLALLGTRLLTVFDIWDVAMLADLPLLGAAGALERLHAASLLEVRGTDRFVLHDLVAEYAISAAGQTLGAEQLRAAIGRLLDAYLRVCDRADSQVTPHRHRFPLAVAAAGAVPDPDFSDYYEALDWQTKHLDTAAALCETAYEHGFDEQCWQLAYALRGVFFLTKHWEQWDRIQRIALAATRRLQDPHAECVTLNNLGLILGERGETDAAHRCLNEAESVCRAARDRFGENTARAHRAWLFHTAGRHGESLTEHEGVLEFYTQIDSPRNVAIVMRDMAASEAALGHTDSALAHLHAAEQAFRKLDLTMDLAMALNDLGETYTAIIDPKRAAEYFEAALAACAESGSDHERARAHAGLGALAESAGRQNWANAHYLQALRLFDALGAPAADVVRARLHASTVMFPTTAEEDENR